jgi:hypothetical protein
MEFPQELRGYILPDAPEEIDFSDALQFLTNTLPVDEGAMDAVLPQSVHKEAGATPLDSSELAQWLGFVHADCVIRELGYTADRLMSMTPEKVALVQGVEVFAGDQILRLCGIK